MFLNFRVLRYHELSVKCCIGVSSGVRCQRSWIRDLAPADWGDCWHIKIRSSRNEGGSAALRMDIVTKNRCLLKSGNDLRRKAVTRWSESSTFPFLLTSYKTMGELLNIVVAVAVVAFVFRWATGNSNLPWRTRAEPNIQRETMAMAMARTVNLIPQPF